MLAAGTTLGPYKILAPLGAGGMGEVYRARDTRLAREVAVKVVRTGLAYDTARLRRFEHEARAAGALNHPNIITIFDVGAHEGAPFVVMELLEGESLRAKLNGGPLPLRDAVDCALQVTRALAAAHARGIVHRDLKPENLFVTREGRVKVLDFGLAKLTRPELPASPDDSTVSMVMSESGVIVGTAAYMAPEQVRGQAVDARSDLFVLGAVIHELVSGQRAFKGVSFIETANAILTDTPAPLSSLRPGVTPQLEALVGRCLQKEPARRFQSADELASGLEAIASAAGRGPDGTVARAGPRRIGRARAAAPVAAGVLAVLAALAAWQGWWPFAPRVPAPPKTKDWILVAEFDAPPADSNVAIAARDLLSAALDQSRIVATVPNLQVQEALAASGRPKDTRLGAEVARELAYRSAVRAVLEGTIGRLGRGYSIVLKVVDADTPRVILTRSGTARDEDALIPALGALARQMRAGLGESRAALQATRPMALVRTPSFEALRLYDQGYRAMRTQSANRKGLGFYRAALAIDPDFATAWLAMTYPYANLGYPDSQLVCAEEALRRPDRLTDGQRRTAELMRAHARGDLAEVVAADDRVLADNPSNFAALGHFDLLVGLGRYEDALERSQRLMKLRPFGPADMDWINLAAGFMYLGRFDEARAAVRHEKGIWREFESMLIERAACRFAAAESIATRYQDDPQIEADGPGGPALDLAQLHFARGSLIAAAATMARADQRARAASDALWPERFARERIEYACLTDGVFPMPPDTWARDTSTMGLVSRGLRATCVGDSAVASRCLAAVRSRGARALVWHGAGPALLEARVALMRGRALEAVRVLRPLSLQRSEVGNSDRGVGLIWVRWTLADAFERAGQPDSAAAHLERNLGVPYRETIYWPLVHRRLALIYARLNRIPDAVRHLRALDQLWDQPDPGVRRILEETRAAVTAGQRRRS